LLEFTCGCLGVKVYIFNKARHALPDSLDQFVGLLVRALDDKLDPAVGQVSHIPSDVVLQGNVPTGVAKPDTLNAPTKHGDRALDRLGSGAWHCKAIYSCAASGVAMKFLIELSGKRGPSPN
jgi:hypothetical protein